MKILFVAHSYPRWAGDRAGSHIHRLAIEAVARGHQVLAVAPHAAGAVAGRDRIDGVEIERFRYGKDEDERIGYQGALSKSLGSAGALLTLPAYFTEFRRAVREATNAFGPDVVSVHWWAPGAIATIGVAAPIAVTCHGSDVRLLSASALVRLLGRHVLAEVQGVSAISQLMADDLRRWAKVPEVAVTRLPVDEARFTPPTSRGTPPTVLFAGNLIHAKGVDVILRAAGLLMREGVPFKLRLVGDGPDRGEFEALAASLGIAPVIEWAGTRGHHQMPEEFAGAAVAVMASRGPRGEGLPMMLVEAMMSGCAVVATPAGAIREIIRDEETGLIANDDDPRHLAEQLGRVLRDPVLRERLAGAGRALALAQHSKERAMDGFFAYLTAVAAKRRVG